MDKEREELEEVVAAVGVSASGIEALMNDMKLNSFKVEVDRWAGKWAVEIGLDTSDDEYGILGTGRVRGMGATLSEAILQAFHVQTVDNAIVNAKEH